MLNLILWSFTLALVPLTAGIFCNVWSAVARSLATPIEVVRVDAN